MKFILLFLFIANSLFAEDSCFDFDTTSVAHTNWHATACITEKTHNSATSMTVRRPTAVNPSRSDLCLSSYYYYIKTTPPPPGKEANASNFNICDPKPPPVTCTWAVSPWFDVGLDDMNSVSCNTTTLNGLYGNETIRYLSAAAWCQSNTTCYGKASSCPKGQVYFKSAKKCQYPVPDPNSPDGGECSSGWISRFSSTSIDGITKQCFTKYICKNDPSLVRTIETSCGQGADDNKPLPGPNGDVTPTTAPSAGGSPSGGSPSGGAGDKSTVCNTKRAVAQNQCQPPMVLIFNCDPRTGEATSTCKDPTAPTPTSPTSGDDTKAATSEDLKNLGNKLPNDIKSALSDFFTDGSTPHLDAIRGSLQASTILQADANDHLEIIRATADASLMTQLETNDKIDSTNSKLDTINDTLKEGKTDQPFDGYNSNDLSTPSDDSSIFDSVSDFATQLKDDATGITTEYNNAKTQVANGFQPIDLPNGQCQDINFMIPGSGVSNTIPMHKIPSLISPYSPIFALLVYLTLMFYIFKFLFLFFISRSK